MTLNVARNLLPLDGRIQVATVDIVVLESQGSFTISGALTNITPFYPILKGQNVLTQEATDVFGAGVYAFGVASFSTLLVSASEPLFYRCVTVDSAMSSFSSGGGGGSSFPNKDILILISVDENGNLLYNGELVPFIDPNTMQRTTLGEIQPYALQAASQIISADDILAAITITVLP